jgi:hypothetical protein
VCERHHHVGGRDQVFGGQVLRAVLDGGAALPFLDWPNSVFRRGQFVADDGGHAGGLGQDVQQVFDDGHHLAVLGDDLVLLQAGQALQAHLQDFLGLGVGQAVQAVLAHAEFASSDSGR